MDHAARVEAPAPPAETSPKTGPETGPRTGPEPGAAARERVSAADARVLARHCIRYREAQSARAWGQFLATLALYLGTFALLVGGLAAGFWPALALAPVAGLLLVRLFTVQHDCGHNSFFASRAANAWVGRGLSVLTLTPYDFWRRAHARHHAGSGDLGRRGIGDIGTLTVREYAALPPLNRLLYRLYRHPVILHLVGPPLYFVLYQRSPFGQTTPPREAWGSIMGLNAALVIVYGGLALVVGPGPALLALASVALVSSWVGAWLFFVQHQFEYTQWEQSEAWDLHASALNGSSYYVLPPVLDWLTGHVGLHHIHHLNSRVPNYRLHECMAGDARLATISRLSLGESLRCVGRALWDEDERRLIRFADLPRPLAA